MGSGYSVQRELPPSRESRAPAMGPGYSVGYPSKWAPSVFCFANFLAILPDRQSGNYPQLGFEEVRAQVILGERSLPTSGVTWLCALLARAALILGGEQTSLPKSRPCRHVITHLFSSGYARSGSYSCHRDDNF